MVGGRNGKEYDGRRELAGGPVLYSIVVIMRCFSGNLALRLLKVARSVVVNSSPRCLTRVRTVPETTAPSVALVWSRFAVSLGRQIRMEGIGYQRLHFGSVTTFAEDPSSLVVVAVSGGSPALQSASSATAAPSQYSTPSATTAASRYGAHWQCVALVLVDCSVPAGSLTGVEAVELESGQASGCLTVS